jgi:hypothetical protein
MAGYNDLKKSQNLSTRRTAKTAKAPKQPIVMNLGASIPDITENKAISRSKTNIL